MLKRLLALLLCLNLFLTLCACGGKTQNPSEETNVQGGGQTGSSDSSDGNSGSQNTQGSNKTDLSGKGVIICFGDSITEGMAVDKANNYPSVLQKKLGEQITVINAGVAGESSNTILSRANAVDFVVAEDIIFNAGQSEVELDACFFVASDGGTIRYRYGKLGNELSAKNVIIDGAAYTLTGKGEDKYSISRADSTAALTLKKGANAEFDYSGIYDKCYCAIVLMGANDSGLGADELIARYKKIAATSEKFIAIIPHYGTDYTNEFIAAFGDATVNLREYCKEEVWTDYNLEKSEKDEYYISNGFLSAKFVHQGKKGDCHLNELGYKVLANLIYDKGVELGYWS